MDNNTKLTSKKYKTIGELLKAPMKTITLVSNNEKNPDVRNYLFEWLFLNHYSKKEMIGNLTHRIKNIANKPCYYYFVKNIFNNIDILEYKSIRPILNDEFLRFIKLLHEIEPALTGVFLDYLMRKIISEKMNQTFCDTRAKMISCRVDDTENIKESYNICINSEYKTENILSEIFNTSLSHTIAFCGILNQDKIKSILNLIQNTPEIIEIFFNPLSQLCTQLIGENSDILLNPCLGYGIPEINDLIPSDCDLVIQDILYDIKCPCGDNSVYEILQLLGYA
jgi:hypothetical protein